MFLQYRYRFVRSLAFRLGQFFAAGKLVFAPGRNRIFRIQNGGGVAPAVRVEKRHQQRIELHLTGLDPRLRLGPELLAVRTERIGKDKDLARGVIRPFLQGMRRVEVFPHLASHRGIDLFLEVALAEVLPFVIIKIT